MLEMFEYIVLTSGENNLDAVLWKSMTSLFGTQTFRMWVSMTSFCGFRNNRHIPRKRCVRKRLASTLSLLLELSFCLVEKKW
jgi:hypothetical protein